MKQKRSEILRMARGILAAPDDALACRQVSAQLPAAVDARIAGEDIAERFPDLAAHLEFCAPCRRQFEELLEITQVAEAGHLAEPERLPQFSLQQVRARAEKAPASSERGRFLLRLRRYLEALQAHAVEPGVEALRKVIREGTSTLALLVIPARPAFQPMPVRSSLPLQTRQFAYHIEPVDLQVTLKVREFERHRFTVRGLIESDHAFDGLGVSLLSSEDDELLDCTRVDDTNTFSFHSLGPGHYSVRLDITAEEAVYFTGVDI